MLFKNVTFWPRKVTFMTSRRDYIIKKNAAPTKMKDFFIRNNISKNQTCTLVYQNVSLWHRATKTKTVDTIFDLSDTYIFIEDHWFQIT